MVDVPRAAKRADKIFRVLVVDDEQLVLKLLARALARPDFEVAEASSGPAALDLMAAERFDLVISDVQMPLMSGIELARRLQQHRPGLPVVLISGAFELAQHQQPADVGAFAVLGKPFTVDELQAVALRALGSREVPLESRTMNIRT
ncbi:MAG TPA: response regulator [Polyangiaceae bacterium]|nr:response regulator [Polyangiaceae bacterium]